MGSAGRRRASRSTLAREHPQLEAAIRAVSARHVRVILSATLTFHQHVLCDQRRRCIASRRVADGPDHHRWSSSFWEEVCSSITLRGGGMSPPSGDMLHGQALAEVMDVASGLGLACGRLRYRRLEQAGGGPGWSCDQRTSSAVLDHAFRAGSPDACSGDRDAPEVPSMPRTELTARAIIHPLRPLCCFVSMQISPVMAPAQLLQRCAAAQRPYCLITVGPGRWLLIQACHGKYLRVAPQSHEPSVVCGQIALVN